jgi:peptidoglycan/LPS O-acetylase OafA/YrhL
VRDDIQFLRGIAVLFVVIYHSGLDFLPFGYLGVDIFFVISGFLITKLVLVKLENNSFSFLDFYYRRARRLLPALYCTLLFTSVFSIFFLTKSQVEDYASQFIGAITFSANMVLPGQTGYFDAAAEGKPLLHIWSLSLEEQYYFLLPLFLFLLPKKLRLIGLSVGFVVSILWCYAWMASDRQDAPFLWRFGETSRYEWAFYLLPTRAWELIAGSICAWLYIYYKPLYIRKWLKKLALAVIFLFGTLNLTPSHPNIEALIVVIATSILLLGQDNWLPKNILVKTIGKVGNWSYSIYLVHWPLFAFAYLSFVGKVPAHISFTIIFLSIVLGYWQFKFVETPFRYKEMGRLFSKGKPIVAITSLLMLIPIGLASHPLYGEYSSEVEDMRKTNHGLGAACEDSFYDELSLKPDCQTSDLINTVVWGDSYAMHLVPGLRILNPHIAQITKSSCGPFIGIATVSLRYGRQWAEECIDYNEKAINFIKNNKNVTHVVMSSTLQQYLGEGGILTEDGLKKRSLSLLVASYKKVVDDLSNAGKHVVFFSPPPTNGRDIGECLERKFGPAIMFREDCNLLVDDYFTEQKLVLEALEEFNNISNVYYLSDLLCDAQLCQSEINNIFIYRDGGHLSISGSRLLLGNLKVSEL